jgi:hypothetical protein
LTSPPPRASWFWFLAAAVLFSLQTVPGLLSNSPTNDEPLEITDGTYYWEGDVATHNRHPPLVKALQALPGRWMASPVERHATPDALERAFEFLFLQNGKKADALVASARGVSLLFGLGLGLLLFSCLRKDDPTAAVWALVFWAFEPTILAYSGLAMADGPSAFFGLAAVLAYRRSVRTGTAGDAVAAGSLAAMAVTAKFSGLALVPILVILEFLEKSGSRIKRWSWGTAGFFFFVGLVYLPGWWGRPQGNWMDSYGFFWGGLQDMMKYGREAHHPTFFLGEALRQNHWLYFPTAFVLKTTLPFLLLLVAALARCFRRRGKLEAWIWVPAVAFFLSVLGAQNLGVRYLLPAFPFLLIAAARTAAELSSIRLGNRGIRWGIFGLGVWHAATAWASFPAHLSYFNDLVPKNKKMWLLGDSNLDLGQDVKRLAETSRRKGWPAVRLATSIGVDPGFYGMSWDWWTEKDLEGPQPGRVYAVNVSFLQLTPLFHPGTTPIARSWIARTAPTEKVGETWFVWEIPGKAVADRSRPLVSAPGLLRFAERRPDSWPGPVFPKRIVRQSRWH